MRFDPRRPARRPAWQDSPEVKKLYEAAKKEGKVIVWGTQRREVEWIPAAFGAMFPGIEVQVLGDNEIATRAISEARAGRHQVDVYWHSLTGTMPLVQRDLLVANDWTPFGVVKENTAFDGKMGFTSNIVYTIVYNTKAVKESDVPKNWTDVLDPRLKGKMTASMFLAPRFVGALGIAWGEEKALQYARDLREKTDILLTRAPRESLLQSGERVISVGEIDSQVRAWIAEGLPVAFVVPEPVIVGQFGASVMAQGAEPERRAPDGRLPRVGRRQGGAREGDVPERLWSDRRQRAGEAAARRQRRRSCTTPCRSWPRRKRSIRRRRRS